MPLEQIGSRIRVNDQNASIQKARPRNIRLDSSEPAAMYDSDNEDWHAKELTSSRETSRYEPQDMTLLKLGGVGGVQRSGSWGSQKNASRAQFQESIDGKQQQQQQQNRKVWQSPLSSIKSLDRPLSSGEPSSSGQSSTSSSSAAAFSLRSLAKRNSDESTSSSTASSSLRRRQGQEEDERSSTASAAATIEAAGDGQSDTTYASPFKASRMDATKASSSSSVATQIAMEEPSSDVGPSVARIYSIGRGYDTRKAKGKQRPSDAGDSEQDETLQSISSGGGAAIGESTYTSVVAPHFDQLTLMAAAKAPPTPPQDSPKFPPPEPRRHTGSFALRSRSALSQTLGSALNFGGGQGRAAARQELAKSRDASGVGSDDGVRGAGGGGEVSSSTSTGKGSNSSITSPRIRAATRMARPSMLTLNAAAASQYTASADDELNRRMLVRDQQEGASPRLLAHLRGALLSPTGLEAARSEGDLLGPPMQELGTGGAFLASSPARSAFADSSVGGSSGGGVARPRPPNSRTNTSLASMNVLRTPTTEEWSRYLIRQGLDPSLRNAGKVAESNRSRSSTSRSIGAGFKRRISDKEVIQQGAPSTSASMTALDPEAMMEALKRSVGIPSAEAIQAVVRRARRSISNEGPSADNEAIETVLKRQFFEDDDNDVGRFSGSDGESSDGIDERMRALHEAISRPPSRRGSPTPIESIQSGVKSDPSIQLSASIQRNLRWPSRDTAAALMGYPLPPVGTQRNINDFVILNDIGRGAYGLVKKARVRDDFTGEPVGPEFCIKYIIKSRILADCWRRHKVLGPIPVEIHVLDQLRRLPFQMPEQPSPWSPEKLFTESANGFNPNVVTVGHPSLCMMVDFFEDHEFYYAVMPCFGAGQDLFDYIESQPHGLTTKQVRCVFGQLADGLRFLHQNGIVHRDVKDENVILDGHGHIQLIDFGSAAHIITRNGTQRLFDTFSGTLDYAAAEILRGEKYRGKELS